MSATARLTTLGAILLVFLTLYSLLLQHSPWGSYLAPDAVADLLRGFGNEPWAPLLLVALLVLASVLAIPVSPLVFASGAVFGWALGWLLNLGGLVLGAAISFWLARRLGARLVSWAGGGERLERVEEQLPRTGFWSLVGVRFLPLPFAFVNYGAALAGVDGRRFVLTSALGLAVPVLGYTFFGASLIELVMRWPELAKRHPALMWTALAVGAVALLLPLARRLRRS